MRPRPIRILATLAATGLLIAAYVVPGCSSPPAQPQSAASTASAQQASLTADVRNPQSGITSGQSVMALREELVRSKVQIATVLDSLTQMQNQGSADLRPAYDEFNREVDATHKRANSLRRQAETSRAKAREYLRTWEGQSLMINDPSIRQQAEQRQATVRADANRIVLASQEARDAFGPFVSDLDDVRSYLATDLTPRGVAAIQPAARKANDDGKQLQKRLDAVIAELDRAASESAPASEAQTADANQSPPERTTTPAPANPNPNSNAAPPAR